MKLSRRHLLLAGSALLVLPGASRAAETVKVLIPAAEASFKPSSLQVKVGDSVEWTNESIVVHTVTCDPAKAHDKKNCALPEGAKPFDSGDLNQDGVFTQVFTLPGSYRYFCSLHEGMNMVGTVVVSA